MAGRLILHSMLAIAVAAMLVSVDVPQTAGAEEHASYGEGGRPAERFFADALPDLLESGLLEVPGFGQQAVNASALRSAVTASWELQDGVWVDVGAPQRYQLHFVDEEALDGLYYYSPAEESAVLSIFSSNPDVHPGYELSYTKHGARWLVERTTSMHESAGAGNGTSHDTHDHDVGSDGDVPDSSGGSDVSEPDSRDFALRCTLQADCLHPEAIVDLQLEGDEDTSFVTLMQPTMTLSGAWVYSDDAWTASTLSSAANAMEDRLWVQEAGVALDIQTYKLAAFPGSWEPWDGTDEWHKFRAFLHDKQTVPSSYTSEFHSSPKLLQKIRNDGNGLSITYFTSAGDGNILGWGRICSPGTWSSSADYSHNTNYLCRHAAVLTASKFMYHRQSYDIGYTATHEMQHVLGMSSYSDPSGEKHVAEAGGKKTENSCLQKVKWYEPLKARSTPCYHSHFWWTAESEEFVRLHLLRIQQGDPDLSSIA